MGLVAHRGFEPLISALRGRCPGPLDECATPTAGYQAQYLSSYPNISELVLFVNHLSRTPGQPHFSSRSNCTWPDQRSISPYDRWRSQNPGSEPKSTPRYPAGMCVFRCREFAQDAFLGTIFGEGAFDYRLEPYFRTTGQNGGGWPQTVRTTAPGLLHTPERMVPRNEHWH